VGSAASFGNWGTRCVENILMGSLGEMMCPEGSSVLGKFLNLGGSRFAGGQEKLRRVWKAVLLKKRKKSRFGGRLGKMGKERKIACGT